LIYANRALVFAPTHPDAAVMLAELYANMNQFEEANYFADKILKLGRPQTTNPINEMDYNVLPLRIKAEFAMRQGRLDDAISLLKDIYKYSSVDLLNCIEMNFDPTFSNIIITPAKNLLLFKYCK
jgi:tetratricopeptide (TPR) repeat protein